MESTPPHLLRLELAGPSMQGLVKRPQAVDYIFRLLSKEHILSFLDQAAVSGTSFLTTLIIARSSNASQLGLYAVAVSLLASLLAFQDSLILQPYTIQRHYTDSVAFNRKGASLILSLLFSLLITLLIGVASGVVKWSGDSDFVLVTLAAAAALPFVLTREFARRVAMAHLEMKQAFVLDLVVGAIQISSLAWLGLNGKMSAVTACAALGGASAIGAFGWLYCARREVRVNLSHLLTTFQQTWSLGKWLFLGRITVQVQNYLTYWITMIIAGAALTGIYAACMSIVSIANPLIFAIGNVMTPRLALAWKNGGGPALRREALRHTVLFAAAMVALTLIVAVGGERIMYLLYPGNEYAGHANTLTVLILATFAGALGNPASFGLATMERARAIVFVGTIGALLSVVLISLFLSKWGLLGAAYGLLAGNVIGAAGRWIAFSVLVPRRRLE